MDSTQRNKQMDTIKRCLGEKQTVVFLPENYGLEYLILENEAPHSWVTFVRCDGKKEGNAAAYYSCAKIAQGIDLYRTTGIPFVVYCAWDDSICASRIYNTEQMQIQWHPHGEPVYLVPHQHFAVRHLRKY
jgi:hypothetical protein